MSASNGGSEQMSFFGMLALPEPNRMDLDRLTSADRRLLQAIKESEGHDGAARSLFHVAVRVAEIDYPYAHNRLQVLESLGYINVQRSRPGLPLVMTLRAPV